MPMIMCNLHTLRIYCLNISQVSLNRFSNAPQKQSYFNAKRPFHYFELQSMIYGC